MSNNHSKYKNTGILYELLVRQIANDVITNKNSKAINIINEFFKQNNELGREFRLYQILIKDKFTDKQKAQELLNIVLQERKKLDERKLKNQKYALVKVIKENFDEDNFFKSTVENYRILASIYSLFESVNKSVNPKVLVESKFQVLDFIVKEGVKKYEPNFLSENYAREDKEIKIMAYKILIDKFNDKYSNLNEDQKTLLREYINSISKSKKLKQIVTDRISKVKVQLNEIRDEITDEATTIKLNEVTDNIDVFVTKSKTIEDQILALMRYYELVKEINNIKTGV